MSIGARLAIAFTVMIALTLAVGSLGLSRMHALNETTTRLVEDRFGKVRLAQEGVKRINDNARIALRLFLTRDPAEFDRRVKQQLETTHEITRLYDDFKSRIDSDEERAAFDDILAARQDYVDARSRAEAVLRAGGYAEAQSEIETSVLPKLNVYIGAWDRLVLLEGRRMTDAAERAAAVYADVRRLTIGLVALAALLGAFVAFFVTRQITRPILAIARAAGRLERGELDARVDVHSKDEIGVLARAFNTMGEAVAYRQERLEREMSLAQEIQTAILPRKLAAPGFELAAAMKPATEVGGDYYDVLPVDGGAWIGVGDVSGHGLDAGLVMLMIQSSIATLVREDPRRSPRSVIVTLNRVIYENLHERLAHKGHATLVVLRVAEDGSVVFAGAHEEILVCRAGTGKCESIDTLGTWVGGIPDVDAATTDATFQMNDGDVLVLFTDGFTEARNADGEMFGIERLIAAIEASRDARADLIAQGVIEAVRAWAEKIDDDMSLVVARHVRPSA